MISASIGRSENAVYDVPSSRSPGHQAMIRPTISIADRICSVVMLSLVALELIWHITGVAWAEVGARTAALALMVVVAPRFGLREWAMTAIAIGLASALLLRPGGLAPATEALRSGAFFSAFILSMMLLRQAAMTSDSVLRVGEWITRQPPGRRFYTIWFGGHFAGILLNFGAVSLLAPLIQRGVRVAEADPHRQAILERRQLSALIRGFSPVIAWSPTTLTQVIILASVPGLDPGAAIAMGLGLSALMLVIARVEDRLHWGRPRSSGPVPDFPRRAGLDLAFVYTLLVAGAVTVVFLLDGALPVALMTVAPVILIGWIFAQARLGTLEKQGAAARLRQIALVAVPATARDAFLLGAAGFVGISAAHLAPVPEMAAWIEDTKVPAWLIVAAIPALITLGGQIALSPMVMVVFLAAVVQALPILPAPPAVIAVALSAGWALSMTAAPNSTGAILISGATGVATTTFTWHWNGLYSLAVLVALTTLFWIAV